MTQTQTSIVPCPRCHFGNQPTSRTCVYCLDPLPYTKGTARHKRLTSVTEPVDALAESGEGEEGEAPPSPSSRLSSVDPDDIPEDVNIAGWLSCPPLPPIPLGPRPILTLGRGPDCDLVLPHTEVSRTHACIKVRGKTVQIEDEGSSNGTFINGRRLTAGTLKVGDSVKVGPYILDVFKEPPERSTEELEHSGDATALVLSGNLDEVSVAEVLQNIEFNKWTGILKVARPGGRAEVEVVAGRPVRAFHGKTRGREAIMSLIKLDHGKFSFARAPVAAGGDVINITALLLEATRALDEGEKPAWISQGSAAAGAVSDEEVEPHRPTTPHKRKPKSLADSSEIEAVSAYMTADSASQSGEIRLPDAPKLKKRPPRPPLPPAGPHGTITSRLDRADVEAVSPPGMPKELTEPHMETTIAPSLKAMAAAEPEPTSAPVDLLEPLSPRGHQLQPPPRSRWPEVALFLLAPLLIVVPLASWSKMNAVEDHMVQERVRWITGAIEQVRREPMPVRNEGTRLQELRNRLDGLRGDSPELVRANQRLLALEGLVQVSRGELDEAQAVLDQPELKNQDAPASALRGALAAATGETVVAVPALTKAIDAGWERTELYEWRALVSDVNDVDSAKRVLTDLAKVTSARGRLTPEQQSLKVRALLAQDFVPAASEGFREIVRPDPQLRWAVVLGRVGLMLKDGAFREARALLHTVEGTAPEFRAAPIREVLREVLSKSQWKVQDPASINDEDLASLLDLWYVELRLRTSPVATWTSDDDHTLKDMFACMGATERPLELYLSAAELAAFEGLHHRRELLVLLYMQLEPKRRSGRFKEQLVLTSILNTETDGANEVEPLYVKLRDPTQRSELYLARGVARERLGKPRLGLRDVIRAKKINPDLDVVEILDRMRAAARKG